MSDQIWDVPASAAVPPGEAKKWKHNFFTIAKSIQSHQRSGGGPPSYFSSRHGLVCRSCSTIYHMPGCAKCGGGHNRMYHGVLFSSGGAGLACENCQALFVAWSCPSCGTTQETNTTTAEKEEGCAGGCMVAIAIVVGLLLMRACVN